MNEASGADRGVPARTRVFTWYHAVRCAVLFAGLMLWSCRNESTQPRPPPASALPVTSVFPVAALSSSPVVPSADSAPPSPPRPDWQQADIDPKNDTEIAPPAPLEDCNHRLEQMGITYREASIPLKQKRGDVFTCGTEQAVTYVRGPSQIRYNSSPRLTCRMALALAHFEKLVQEEAERHLGQRVIRMTQLGTYSCRKMVRFDYVSEHSYGNAIDISAFVLRSGERVTVLHYFGALDSPPKTRYAKFLRAVAHRAFDEDVFSVVLTPYWDKLHRDHFHLDLARYRVDGTRP